jgi:hypothetical protein
MAYSKEEKEKNQVILLAMLKYLLENHTVDMVFDNYSPSEQVYLQELRQTELDIQNSRSAKIKKRLDRHLLFLREKLDVGFNKYIKENTPYEIDIFEGYKTDVMPILEKGTIDFNDVNLVEKYLKVYNGVSEEQKNVALLKDLLTKHEAYMAELFSREDVVTEKFYGFTNRKKSWTVDEAGYEQLFRQISKDWLLEEETAPNKTNKLQVQISGKGDYALTYVIILLENAGSGTIYCARGEKLPIKAYWKDNHTVVVETKSTYQYHEKYQQVRSYDEVFKIEYIEV